MPRQNHRRTKIVCTIGPKTGSPVMIERLMRAGMDVARLNLSHGDYKLHDQWAKTIRKTAAALGRNVAILLDLPGPKFRVGPFKGGKVRLKKGAVVTITTRAVEGDETLLPVNLPSLADDIRPGQIVLLNDGAFELKVESVKGTEIRCRVKVGGVLENNKGLDVPGMRSSSPFMTEAVARGIEFAATQKPDYIAMSFVGKADDVTLVRNMLTHLGVDSPLISKIERVQAVRDFDSILAVSDGIMVARGDMGVELPLERVPIVQKEIIKKCNRAGKPVITATEMLESMIKSPRPTRAEVTDVANAIFDGTDATMLSAETSIGAYPVQAVRMMDRIAREAEGSASFSQLMTERRDWLIQETDELIAFNACLTADNLKAAAITAFTQSGSTARRVSKYRPRTQILALTPSSSTCRRLVLYWGVNAIQVRQPETVDDLFMAGCDVVKQERFGKTGDLIVITAGIPIGIAGTTNLLKVEEVC